MAIAVLVGLASVFGWLCARRIRSAWLAVLISGVLASGLFQILAFVVQGHIDKFILLALPIGTIVAVGVSALVVGIDRLWSNFDGNAR